MRYDRLTDDDLVRLAQDGDREAFDALRARYQKALFNFVCQYTGDYETALDVEQNAWLRVWRKRHHYTLGTNFAAWMHRLAINESKDEFKRRKRRPITSLDVLTNTKGNTDALVVDLLLEEGPGPAEQALHSQWVRRVRMALRRLSPDHQQVAQLWCFAGVPYKEIAEQLRIPIGTVKSRICYTRKYLRKMLGVAA